jgi:hypothetical protein
MKIILLPTPKDLPVPGGTVTATHVAETMSDKVGFRMRFAQTFYVLKDGMDDDGGDGNYLRVGNTISTDIDGDDYEDVIKAVGLKARGNYWISDVRAKAAEIRARNVGP